MMRWNIGVSLCSCWMTQWPYRLLSACFPLFRILEASWFGRQEAVWQGVFAGFPVHASMYSETRGPASHQWCGSWQGKLSTQWKLCLFGGNWFLTIREICEKKVEIAQSCPAFCDPMDCSLSDFSVHGVLHTRTLEWVAIPFSRGSSQPRDRT